MKKNYGLNNIENNSEKGEFIAEDMAKNDVNVRAETRKTNRFTVFAILFSVALILTFFLGYLARGYAYSDSGRIVTEINKIIDDTSIYADKLTADKIAELIRKEILANDKYARYYTPEEYKTMLEEGAGNYSGMGVAIAEDGTIIRVSLNSPAFHAGVKVGDKFIAGKVKGEEDYSYFNEIKDENGELKPTVQAILDVCKSYYLNEKIPFILTHDGENAEYSFAKEDYIVSYVEYFDDEKFLGFATDDDGFFKDFITDSGKQELPSDTAYIKLYEFEGGAATQFSKAMEFMKERNKTKLVLDLRDNGGGLINILLEIASHLVNNNGKGNIKIMGVEEKSGTTHYSTVENNFYEGLTDISVIANGNTASASECLIGALIAYGNAERYGGANFSYEKLVLTDYIESRGDYTTYGKGIMQTTYGLMSGGALTLTTAKIYWPGDYNTVCVQDEGIKTTLPENKVKNENAIARAVEILHAKQSETNGDGV